MPGEGLDEIALRYDADDGAVGVEDQHRTDAARAQLLGNLADRGAGRDRENKTALTRQDIGDEHGFPPPWLQDW